MNPPEVYTIISARRPTEVGLRGYPAVQTISAADADNRHSETTLNLLFGDAVRGLDSTQAANLTGYRQGSLSETVWMV